jgi:hypothetical protein
MRVSQAAAAFALAFFCWGCNNSPRFIYSAGSAAAPETASVPVKVVVAQFEDQRPDDDDFAMWFLGAIPPFPYGWAEYDYPDESKSFATVHSFLFNPREDLAKAAAASLSAAGIFKEAKFSFDGKPDPAGLVLEGKIKSLRYKGRVFTYCMSYPGMTLWLFGAPAATSMNRVSLTMTLRDSARRVLWEYSFDKEDYLVQWLYRGYCGDCGMYSKLTAAGMREAFADLAAKIRQNPGQFKH